MRWIYTRLMGILNILKVLVALTKDSKTMTASVILLLGIAAQAGMTEVNRKHDLAMAEIERTKAQIAQLSVQQAAMLSTLESIKHSVANTEERVWQIARDVTMMRRNHRGAKPQKESKDDREEGS